MAERELPVNGFTGGCEFSRTVNGNGNDLATTSWKC
jgi:hypothetical protein